MFSLAANVVANSRLAVLKIPKLYRQRPAPGERYTIGSATYLAQEVNQERARHDDYHYYTVKFTTTLATATAGDAVTWVRR